MNTYGRYLGLNKKIIPTYIYSISTAERNNVVSRRLVEKRCISPRGWRTSHLAARMKKDVSHRAVQERRISARGRRSLYLGAFTSSTWPIYDEIWRSSSAWRDTTFFNRPVRYVLLHPRSEMRRSSSTRWDTTFFNRAPRYDVVPLNRRYTRPIEERRISPHGRWTSYLVVNWPCTGRKSTEIQRSS